MKLHFSHPSLKDNFSRAFMLYKDRLLMLYTTHTWESVRLFHLLFHKSRVSFGIDNPEMWRRIDITLEYGNLVCREPKTNQTFNYCDQRPHFQTNNYKNIGNDVLRQFPICNRFNSGKDYQNCRYQHVCSVCSSSHSATVCNKTGHHPTNGNPNKTTLRRRE